ncbi:MAG: PQQ-binding-like beta-propeller repeat protein [Thermoplasmata archaeon]
MENRLKFSSLKFSNLKVSITIILIGLLFLSPTYSALPVASYKEKWPQIMGGPAHTGYYNSTCPEGNGTFLKKQLIGLDSGGEEWPPVIDEDSFYIPFSSWVIGGPDGKKNSVARYSRSDGSLIWKHEMDEQIWSGVHSLALYKNTVILSASKWAYYTSEPHDFLWGKIVALNKDTGDELWTYRIDMNTVSEIAVYDNKVFFATGGYWYMEGGYYAMCLSADTGKVVWQSEISNRISSAPSVSEDVAIYPVIDGMVYAFSAVDVGEKNPLTRYPEGKLMWSKPACNALQTLPIINASTVYLTSNSDGGVIALDLKSGKEIWRKTIGNPGGTGMCLGDGMIYAVFITKEFSELCALQQKDGTVSWRMRTNNITLGNYPICCRNGIYTNARNSTSNFVYRISLKGELLWCATFNGTLANTGSIADGILYSVGYIGGWLYAFDGSGGGGARANERSGLFESVYVPIAALSAVLIATAFSVIFISRHWKRRKRKRD